MEFPKNQLEFYKLILNEEKMRDYLIEKKLLQGKSNNNFCNLCGSEMRIGIRNKRKKDGSTSTLHVLRCTNKQCKTTRSIRNDTFFTYQESVREQGNCKLTVNKILEIVWQWCANVKINICSEQLDVSEPTLVDWYNHLREVCLFKFENAEKMGGTWKVVQIDESYFNGKLINYIKYSEF